MSENAALLRECIRLRRERQELSDTVERLSDALQKTMVERDLAVKVARDAEEQLANLRARLS